jgi:hypothetical protein
MVGHKTGQIYFGETQDRGRRHEPLVCAVDPNTKTVREDHEAPRGQEVSTVNADETLLGGTFIERNDWGTNNYFDGGPNRLTTTSKPRTSSAAKKAR